jgi:hypothetical protein
MTPRYATMWEVNARHPDKTEPHDFFCRFYQNEEIALDAKAALGRDGWEDIHIVPPRNPRAAERTRYRKR